MLIVPSILTNSPEDLAEKIARCEGVVDRVQIDIVDGVFADNKTIDPTALKYIETDLKLDFHLMVTNPAAWIEKCAGVGAVGIIGQIEMMASQSDFVKKVALAGASPGLAVNITTPLDQLEEGIVAEIDSLLLMSIPAGFGGQKFDTRVYEKIKQINTADYQNEKHINIGIDGGVSQDNIGTLFKLKVDEAVIGGRLFAGDLKINLETMLKAARGGG